MHDWITVRRTGHSPSNKLRRPWWILLGVLLAACESEILDTPIELRGRLVSPNGPEGAAILEIVGAGLGEARPVTQPAAATASSGEGSSSFEAAPSYLFSRRSGDTLRLVIVLEEPAAMEFAVEWFRRTTRPEARVLEVVDGNNLPRGSLTGYRVEFTP